MKKSLAFPTIHTIDGNWVNEPREEYQGMTLRDYFAAKAMQALIASRNHNYESGHYDEDRVATSAYVMADAMLVERDK